MEIDFLFKKIMLKVIEATILNGKSKGENVLILRLPVIPTDMPFEFKRFQFPVRLAFSMTINKAQGLENPCFAHGNYIFDVREWEIPQNYSFLRKTEKQKILCMPKHFNN